MKGTFLLFYLVGLTVALSSLPESAPGVDNFSDDEEMDYDEAKTRELTDSVLDVLDEDEEDDNQANTDHFNNDILPEGGETLAAKVDEEGMIEIEDMVLTPDMFEVIFPAIGSHPDNSDHTSVHRRAAITSKKKLWPKGRVVYNYSKKLRGSTAKIRAAMDEWEKNTCITFDLRNKTMDRKWVLFRTKFDKDGKMMGICSSALGYSRRAPQYINLAAACFSHKTILHEIGHALGLIHEHQHPSRDKFVTINWANVNPKKASNFRAKKGVSDYGLPYDPTSVMHYGSQSFKKYSCQKPCITIEANEGYKITQVMGKAKHLSKLSDIPVVNKMYKCDASQYLTKAPKSPVSLTKPNVSLTKPNVSVSKPNVSVTKPDVSAAKIDPSAVLGF